MEYLQAISSEIQANTRPAIKTGIAKRIAPSTQDYPKPVSWHWLCHKYLGQHYRRWNGLLRKEATYKTNK